jgi:hypothetical protein
MSFFLHLHDVLAASRHTPTVLLEETASRPLVEQSRRHVTRIAARAGLRKALFGACLGLTGEHVFV